MKGGEKMQTKKLPEAIFVIREGRHEGYLLAYEKVEGVAEAGKKVKAGIYTLTKEITVTTKVETS